MLKLMSAQSMELHSTMIGLRGREYYQVNSNTSHQIKDLGMTPYEFGRTDLVAELD
jgi:hypothetical protein